MGKVKLTDIVNLPAFEEAGDLFFRTTGMPISFHDDSGEAVFYPREQRCEFCRLVQSSPEGRERCKLSDRKGAAESMRSRSPLAYTCHAGLTDVVVPVVVGDERIGCFFSGQLLLASPTPLGYEEALARVAGLHVDPGKLWQAYQDVPQVDASRLEQGMGLLSIICNHLVESEMALRTERELTREHRRLRRAAEEKARLERDLREMEVRLLQSQLNPHFLFNSLNLILGECMAEGAVRSADLVDKLAELLRGTLASIGTSVTLAAEVECVRAYVDIFRARFDREVRLDIAVPRDVDTLKVPSLILQPLVENALVHGFPASEGPFSIEVAARRSEELVEITVADNGSGLTKTTLARIARSLREQNHKGKMTGLLGLNRRLKYYYPGFPGLRTENRRGGLSVTISLPAAYVG